MCLAVLLSLLRILPFVDLLEDENGVPFEAPSTAAYVVLDGQSCGLCTPGVLDFITTELKGVMVYTVIDSNQPRSTRYIDLDRHKVFLEESNSAVLFPRPKSPQIKSYVEDNLARTPFIIVMSNEEHLVIDLDCITVKSLESEVCRARLQGFLGK